MTDERFEGELRATLAQLMDLQAPRTLRADVDRVLSGEADARPSRRTPALVLWGLGVAAVFAVVAVAGIGLRLSSNPSIVASSAPSEAPSGLVGSPGPSAPPTYPPDWAARTGLPVVDIAAREVRRTSYAFASDGPVRSGAPATGPFIYRTTIANTAVNVLDIGGGSVATISVPLLQNEQIHGTRSDGKWLAVEVNSSTTDHCVPAESYRILVARLGADGRLDPSGGGFEAVAEGSVPEYLYSPADERSCVYSPPAMDLAHGRLAWADPAIGGATASTIHIRTLDGSAPAWTVSATTNVVILALSGEAVAWVESRDPDAGPYDYLRAINGYPKTRFDWHVAEASLADGVRHPVDIGEAAGPDHPYSPQIGLDGTAVVATRFQPVIAAGATPAPSPGTAKISSIATSVVRTDDAGITVIDDGSSGRQCTAGSPSDGVVPVQCWFAGITIPTGGTVGTGQPYLGLAAVWTPASGLRIVTDRPVEPDQAWAAWAQSGWLITVGGNKTSDVSTYSAYPLSLLTAP